MREERDISNGRSAYKRRNKSLMDRDFATLIKDTGKMTERSCERYTIKRRNALIRVSKEDISYSNSKTVSPMKIPIRPYFQIFKERSVTSSSMGGLKEVTSEVTNNNNTTTLLRRASLHFTSKNSKRVVVFLLMMTSLNHNTLLHPPTHPLISSQSLTPTHVKNPTTTTSFHPIPNYGHYPIPR